MRIGAVWSGREGGESVVQQSRAGRYKGRKRSVGARRAYGREPLTDSRRGTRRPAWLTGGEEQDNLSSSHPSRQRLLCDPTGANGLREALSTSGFGMKAFPTRKQVGEGEKRTPLLYDFIQIHFK